MLALQNRDLGDETDRLADSGVLPEQVIVTSEQTRASSGWPGSGCAGASNPVHHVNLVSARLNGVFHCAVVRRNPWLAGVN